MHTVFKDTPPPIRLVAGCKLNLYLNIVGVLPDGYHSLETLFYYLPEPHDFIEVSPGAPGQGLRLFCPGFPNLENEHNILARAYDLFSAQSGRRYDLDVTLRKNIPMGAGLGGGSADAAALLVWLNQCEGNKDQLNVERLMPLAARLGADVPFFVYAAKNKGARAAWGRGIGEKLTPADISPLHGFHLLLIFPEVEVSTPWAYGAWDDLPQKQRIFDAFFASEYLTSAEPEDKYPHARALRLYNSFEAVVFSRHVELRRIKERLLRDGATAALMSGSGSTIFGLFRDARKAEESAAGFSRENYNYILQKL